MSGFFGIVREDGKEIPIFFSTSQKCCDSAARIAKISGSVPDLASLFGNWPSEASPSH